jgi:AAA family ATP:ADP antiporter
MIQALRYTSVLSAWKAQGLPYAYFLSAVVTGFVLYFHMKIQAKISKQALINSSLVFFIITGLLLQFLLMDYAGKTLALVVWVWAAVLSVVLMTHFWLTISDVYNPREAKRLIGFCGSGGPLGGVLGGLLANFLTKSDLPDLLLPTACFFLVLCVVVVKAIFSLRQQQAPAAKLALPKPEAQKKKGLSFRGSFDIVRKNDYLLLMSGIMVVTVIISTFVDFQFTSVVNSHFILKHTQFQHLIDRDTQAFFGLFFAGLTTFAFFIQLIFTSKLLARYGTRNLLMLAPAIIFLCSWGIWFAPGLLTAILIKGNERSFAFSINRSVREMLYLPIPSDLKHKTKPFIDIFVSRSAKALSAAMLFILFMLIFRTPPGESHIVDFEMAQWLSWLIMGFIGIWVFLNLRIRKRLAPMYEKTIKPEVPRADIDVAEKVDIELMKQIFDTIESQKQSPVLYALNLMDLVDRNELTPELKQIISPTLDEVEVSAAAGLFDAEGVSLLLEKEEDLSREDTMTSIKKTMLSDTYQQVMHIHAERILAGSGEAEVDKMELAKFIGFMPPDSPLVAKLEQLMKDGTPHVVRYAMESAAKLKKEEFIPAIVQKLRSSLIRDDAVSALKVYGDTALTALETGLMDVDLDMSTRRAVINAMAQIGSQKMSDVLVRELIRYEDEEIEHDIIDALERIRSQDPGIRFPQAAVKKETFLFLKKYCRTYLNLHGLREAEREKGSESGERKALETKLKALIRDVFRLLSLCHPQEKIRRAYQNLRSEDKESQANAIELLDLYLDRDFKAIILPLVENVTPVEHAQICRRFLARKIY